LRLRSIRTVAEALALALMLATAASAATAEHADPAAARTAYGEAERLYQLGRFEEAITAYERAFALDQQPAFLFNIALAHRRQFEIDAHPEHLRRARELYRNYLRLEPTTPRRAAIEKLIDDLGARLDREPAPASPLALAVTSPPPQPERTPPPLPPAVLATRPPPPPSQRSTALWWVLGGAAVAAAAVVTVLLVRDRRSTDGPTIDLGGTRR
jgi:tetratricopeptide (TPR) repeat protein